MVVHCGAHKTGTTLLQESLNHNQRALSEQGITYLDRVTSERIVQLLREEATGARVAQVRELLMPFDGFGSTLLISHESIFSYAHLNSQKRDKQFYGDFRCHLDRFMRAAEDIETRFIFYVRRQDTFLESIYLEGYQQGYIRKSFRSFLRAIDIERLSWLRLAECLSRAVGWSNVNVLPFEAMRDGSIAYQRLFLEQICDTEKMVLRPIEGARRSLDMSSYRAIRAADLSLPGLSNWAKGPRRKLIQFLMNRNVNLRRRAAFLSSIERESILGQLAGSNEELFSRFVGAWPPDFYSNPGRAA
jgi:hypothetical protein